MNGERTFVYIFNVFLDWYDELLAIVFSLMRHMNTIDFVIGRHHGCRLTYRAGSWALRAWSTCPRFLCPSFTAHC